MTPPLCYSSFAILCDNKPSAIFDLLPFCAFISTVVEVDNGNTEDSRGATYTKMIISIARFCFNLFLTVSDAYVAQFVQVKEILGQPISYGSNKSYHFRRVIASF